jgi:hypothetical protein
VTVYNENQIKRIFKAEFDRAPDPEGLKYWAAQLDNGLMTTTEIHRALYNSPEGISYLRKKVEKAYSDTLNRAPDRAGVDYWVAQIREGNVPNDMKALGERFLTFETPSAKKVTDQTGTDPVADPVTDPTKGIPDAEPLPASDRYAKTEMKAMLERMGMTPTEEFITEWWNGDWGDAEADIKMREQQFWKDRFPGMEGRQSPMSAAEYIDYESKTIGLMASAGLPKGFYDEPEDIAEWIRSGRSYTQLAAQLEEGYVRLNQVPIEVKTAFARMNGIDNVDGALLAFVMDPDRAQPVLEKMVAAAEVSGSGSLFGVNVGDERSRLLADRGFNLANTQQTFQQLRDQAGVYRESITENTDLTADEEGVNAAFGLDDTSGETIRRRVAGRVGALSGGGGSLLTETGLGGRAGQ